MRIAATDLQIVFGTKKIIDVPDLALVPGEVTIIVGPNGAGKTTTIRMLCGLLRPSAGWARIWAISRSDLARNQANFCRTGHLRVP